MRVLFFSHNLRVAGGKATGANILRAISENSAKNHYLAVVPDIAEYRNLGLENAHFEVVYYQRRLGHIGRALFDYYTLPRIVRHFKPDVICGLGNLGLIHPPCPQAVHIQNPNIFYENKQNKYVCWSDNLKTIMLKRHFAKQLPNTVLVFSQTETMLQRLRSIYGYAGRSIVVSKAVSKFSKMKPTGHIPHKLKTLQDRFKLFYLTRYYPHKNIEALVDMMDRSREALPDALAVITIAPDQHPNARRLLKSIEKRGLNDRILNVGPIEPGELADYYVACDVLVMPTRLESFSGTYLEAMHFGLPILTSDRDFAREVCQDAAIYFDPLNPDDMADKVFALRRDPKLSAMLIEKGHERLQNGFNLSWDDIAATMVNNLETIAKRDMK